MKGNECIAIIISIRFHFGIGFARNSINSVTVFKSFFRIHLDSTLGMIFYNLFVTSFSITIITYKHKINVIYMYIVHCTHQKAAHQRKTKTRTTNPQYQKCKGESDLMHRIDWTRFIFFLFYILTILTSCRCGTYCRCCQC